LEDWEPTISGNGIVIFSNLHNLGMKIDTTKEHEMNWIDLCSIYLIECFLVVSLSVFKLEKVETYERKQYFGH